MTWEQTDDLQFVKRIDEDNFKIIETTSYPDGSYSYGVINIDIAEYSEEDLDYEARGYYGSLKEAKELYGSDWKIVMAEVIAEQTMYAEPFFDNLEKLKIHCLMNHNW